MSRSFQAEHYHDKLQVCEPILKAGGASETNYENLIIVHTESFGVTFLMFKHAQIIHIYQYPLICHTQKTRKANPKHCGQLHR
mmetsp:Transcript_15766/g.20069  ORF Transcript_15766/g.20069 Transcript_15766/m.20069 type:complete len:83 (-) Transcript_15766:630-878(-)